MIVFSIAIPVYNMEKYLRLCLDSICPQAGDDTEVWLLDDGSSDGSETICDEYAAKYSFIHVLHQSNQGVSAARNRLIRLAEGKWLVFVDGDDLLAPHALEVMRGYAKGTEQLIVFESRKFFDDFNTGDFVSCREDCCLTGKETSDFQAAVLDESYQSHRFASWNLCSSWAKMWNLFYLRGIGVEFQTELKFGEDMLFNFIAARNMKQIRLVHQCIYGYRSNESSVTLRFSEDAAVFLGMTMKTLYSKMDQFGEMKAESMQNAFWKKSSSYFESVLAMSIQHPECPWRRREQLIYLQKLCSMDWVRDTARYAAQSGNFTLVLRLAFEGEYQRLACFCRRKAFRYGMIRWLNRRKWGRRLIRCYAENKNKYVKGSAWENRRAGRKHGNTEDRKLR